MQALVARLSALSMWMDLVGPPESKAKKASRTEIHEIKEIVMARVIEFYIPENARKPRKWAPEQQLGKVIEFRSQAKKSA